MSENDPAPAALRERVVKRVGGILVNEPLWDCKDDPTTDSVSRRIADAILSLVAERRPEPAPAALVEQVARIINGIEFHGGGVAGHEWAIREVVALMDAGPLREAAQAAHNAIKEMLAFLQTAHWPGGVERPNNDDMNRWNRVKWAAGDAALAPSEAGLREAVERHIQWLLEGADGWEKFTELSTTKAIARNHREEAGRLRAALSSAPQGWISVADRLPEKGERVLIWFNTGDEWEPRFGSILQGHWCPDMGHGNFDDEVTHWMPFPDPPAAEPPKETR